MLGMTRKTKKILDNNIFCLTTKDHHDIPISLEELVLEILDQPELMMSQIIPHRYCNDMIYGLFTIMNDNTPGFPRFVSFSSCFCNRSGKFAFFGLISLQTRNLCRLA